MGRLSDRRGDRRIRLPRSNNPVRELGVPATDRGVGHRQIHQRERPGRVEIAYPALANEVRCDRVPVTGGSVRSRTVGPEPGDLHLQRRARLGDLPHFRQSVAELLGVESGWRRSPELTARIPQPWAHQSPHRKLRRGSDPVPVPVRHRSGPHGIPSVGLGAGQETRRDALANGAGPLDRRDVDGLPAKRAEIFVQLVLDAQRVRRKECTQHPCRCGRDGGA